jgi:hypothetical protein
MNSLNVANGFVTGDGGCIFVNNGTDLTLVDVNVTNCEADGTGGDGGGIYHGTGMLSITGTAIAGGSIFSGNVAEGDEPNEGGGAIFNAGGTVTITDVSFRSNLANVGALGNGGAVYNAGGIVTVNGGGLTGGDFTGNMANRAGGAIETINGKVILNDVELSNNSTGINGGGLHVTAADTVTVDDGTFSGNVAGQEGGGVWNSLTGMMTIQNGTVIDDNTANVANAAADAQGGGGVFNNGGTLSIDNATITNNTVEGDLNPDDGGGGVFNDGRNINGANVTITNTTIDDNTVTDTNVGTLGGRGGGILTIGTPANTTTLDVTNGSVSNNTAPQAGGGIETNNSKVGLTNVTVDGNSVSINGGGLHAQAADTVTVNGGTVSGNTALQEGGGLWNSSVGTMTIQGATIDNNTANAANDADAQGGGGVFNNGGALTIDNSTITNNTVQGELSPVDGGGGVFNDGRNTDGATVTITNTTINSNVVDDTNLATIGGRGGGILTIGSVLNTTTLDVTGGSVSSNTAPQAGGGVETNNSTTTLTNVNVSTNGVDVNGGGVHVQAADSVTIDGGAFSDNTAGQEGGGLWNSSTGTMTIQNGTIISNNTANTANDGIDAQGGGGTFNNGGTLTIDGTSATVQIVNNTSTGSGADDGGGGVFNDGRNTPGTVTITNTAISGNEATGTSGSGGGILNIEGTVILTNSTVSGNTANRAGNGIEDNAGVLFAVNASTISGNVPGSAPNPGNGGGLHATGAASIEINTSTVSGNSATSEGGGLWNSATGSIDVSASTVVNNSTSTGGGFHNDGGTFTFDNTILGNNLASSAGPDCSGSITSNDYNLIEDTSGCTIAPQAHDITGQDPGLGLLEDNGGPTLTHLPVYPTSPVIDQGNSTGAPRAEAADRVLRKAGLAGTDQRGLPRMADDVSIDNAGNGSDIGSVELNEGILPVELTSFEAVPDGYAVHLTWTTASETNNAGFEVEHRSADTETFERLDFIEGAGTTQEEQSYSYTIDGLDVGRHVFRLKQSDFDGAFTFSHEVEVAIELAEAFRLSAAYPNPFNPQTRFTLAVQRKQDVSVEIYNAGGQRVATLFENLLEANQTHHFTWDAGQLPSGLYLIRTQGETFSAVRRVTLLK